ncbi:ABC transporter ATP-binding protein [Orientia tsutsugamushi]|uniref:Organic solvent ABC transporter ATP-binding protein n=3 Tax=Orientia tsutsugamushi TaxID=784 RepID=A0A2R8F1I7_ORITS|nr:ATP-binding cassette domain-containing protein [Orientia tsutsugamushi]KJV73794.1 ABC transporter family protein [Orientia tsutsugamushi str. TA763]KJV55347.1 ABC transporter family protein [Orientia tsutsugamushi str. Karp]KJW07764.1 ABC transporter family protein [Orientia tsutsugamushi str. UT144]QES96183.1 ATP-binding cassette domain-containing protein [Orientia tsutsugamushi]SPM45286.1 organic solvent ABC transporter ATP-binding protein [Orientia tsutsugamushi]
MSIIIKNLCKAFKSKIVLNKINLELKSKQSIAILGRSGSGKSVLIKTIIGLIKPDAGEIIIDGQDITKLSLSEKFKLMPSCGFLFQGSALFDSLSVEDNITFYAQRLYKLSKSEKRQLAIEKLKLVELSEDIINLYPFQLSGGMQKRVSFARTICTNPKIIFLDEPTTGLDPIMVNIINNLIIKIQQTLESTTIIITHDINSAYKIANNAAMLYQGQIIWHGKTQDLKNCNNEFVQQFIHGSTTGPIKYDS